MIFDIYGEIVESSMMKAAPEDVSPSDVNEFISKLDEGEPIELHINSPGGSVTGGIAIANIVRDASSRGHKSTAVVEGVAASIASVVMCACDTIQVYDTAIIMVHNCWCTVTGNAEELRKAAQTMDVMREAILSFYAQKFYLDNDEIKKMLDDETWFTGSQADQYKLDAQVVSNDATLKIAASASASGFLKILKNYKRIERSFMKDKCQIDEDIEKEEQCQATPEEPGKEPEEQKELEEPEEPEKEEEPQQLEEQEEPEKEEEPQQLEEQEEPSKEDEELEKAKKRCEAQEEEIKELKQQLEDLKSQLEANARSSMLLNASVNKPEKRSTGYWACASREERREWVKKNLKW